MIEPARPNGPRLRLWSAVGFVTAVGARAGWRRRESDELTRLSTPLQRLPAQPSMRLLIVGDSTAEGTIAAAPESSLAGLLGRRFSSLHFSTSRATAQRLPGCWRSSMATSGSTGCW